MRELADRIVHWKELGIVECAKVEDSREKFGWQLLDRHDRTYSILADLLKTVMYAGSHFLHVYDAYFDLLDTMGRTP